MASCPCLERIEPTQPRKAAEVAVVGMNHRLVFDGEGRDVGIGDRGAAEDAGIAEAPEDGQMARTRLQDPHARLIKPRTQMVQRGAIAIGRSNTVRLVITLRKPRATTQGRATGWEPVTRCSHQTLAC